MSVGPNKIVVEAPITELDLAIRTLKQSRLAIDLGNPDPLSIMDLLAASREVQMILEGLRAGPRRLSRATPALPVTEAPKELENV